MRGPSSDVFFQHNAVHIVSKCSVPAPSNELRPSLLRVTNKLLWSNFTGQSHIQGSLRAEHRPRLEATRPSSSRDRTETDALESCSHRIGAERRLHTGEHRC